MRISDWSSDVCSSDLQQDHPGEDGSGRSRSPGALSALRQLHVPEAGGEGKGLQRLSVADRQGLAYRAVPEPQRGGRGVARRSEEHTSELQSLMRISYAVFCLKKKHINTLQPKQN